MKFEEKVSEIMENAVYDSASKVLSKEVANFIEGQGVGTLDIKIVGVDKKYGLAFCKDKQGSSMVIDTKLLTKLLKKYPAEKVVNYVDAPPAGVENYVIFYVLK